MLLDLKAGAWKSNHETDAPITNLLNFAWELKKRGLKEATINNYTERLQRIGRYCDLSNPETVRDFLATVEMKDSTKADLAQKYEEYLKFIGSTWTRPEYARESKAPYIPTEQELDALISAGRNPTTALLRTLKETGVRIGEALALKWTDLDTERQLLYIRAEKGSNDRYMKISRELLGMLNQLRKINDRIFQTKRHGAECTFARLRKKTAQKLQNPRLMQIHLHTFRHWFATTKMHEYQNAWTVKELLGHKTVTSTEIYIHIEKQIYQQLNAGYIVTTAQTIEEDAKLLENGFEYVTERDGLKLYRKRK